MSSRRRRPPKRTTLSFGVPNVAHDRLHQSRALKVHPSQVAEANEVAQSMGCGAPFHKDGMFVDTRANKARYMREINTRADDRGEDRLVNFDGGYGDVT
jgi:hypothetical protein